MNKLDFFKEYCKLKGLENKYAFGFITDDGKKGLEFLNGDKSFHLAYEGKGIKENRLYRTSPATCSEDSGCKVGQPKESCIGRVYSKNKCAVYFFDEVNLENFSYSLNFDNIVELSKLI